MFNLLINRMFWLCCLDYEKSAVLPSVSSSAQLHQGLHCLFVGTEVLKAQH